MVMEELLQKNIFDEKDLIKLSPDYMPATALRMEMRRNMVKDTHGGAGDGFFRSNSCQRKSIKKNKDYFKFNKEIVKIRNTFHNVNLKNKIMLQYVEAMKPKTFTNKDKILITGSVAEIEEEDCYNLKEITENMNNLAIHSDSEFKINDKCSNKLNQNFAYRNYITQNVQNSKNKEIARYNTVSDYDDVESVVDTFLRVECKFIEETAPSELNVETENLVKECEQKDTELKICASRNIYTEKDLKSLLVTMTLTPKLNYVDEHNSHRSYYNSFDLSKTNEDNNEVDYVPYSSRSRISEDVSNILCVAPMRIKISEKQEKLLKKYVEKWRAYVSYKKEHLTEQRKATLDSFFDKLAKKKSELKDGPESVKKAKLLVQDFNTYQRRYKFQKHIIALQRAKLEEQDRLIEELKYKKILEASKESVDALREEVRKNYHELDRKLKPKIKVLSNELNLQNIEEPALVLHCLKVPQFLQRMEKRAREREEKHAMIRERRRQMEEERIRMKQQAELAKAEMDKEEKMQRLKELRLKRKREKIESIRKKQYAARLRALIVMADLHYEKTLLAKYGIRPFKILLEMKRDNIEKAKEHYLFQLKNSVFLHWMWYTEDMWYERNFKADQFRRKCLLRKAIAGFKMNARQYVLQKQVADDYYDLYVTQLVFRKFREGLEIFKKEQEIQWNRAVAYHNSSILFKTFVCWRTLPALNALKRQQDARKARWREKVLQVVPDYTPPED